MSITKARSSRLLTRAQAAQAVGQLTGLLPPSPGTVGRWARVGVGGVKLRSRRIGARLYIEGTSAILEFLRELNGDPEDEADG